MKRKVRTSRQRMVAWGMPKALTGSPGIEQRSMRRRGSSHKESSSESGGAFGSRNQGARMGSGIRRPLRASREMDLS